MVRRARGDHANREAPTQKTNKTKKRGCTSERKKHTPISRVRVIVGGSARSLWSAPRLASRLPPAHTTGKKKSPRTGTEKNPIDNRKRKGRATEGTRFSLFFSLLLLLFLLLCLCALSTAPNPSLFFLLSRHRGRRTRDGQTMSSLSSSPLTPSSTASLLPRTDSNSLKECATCRHATTKCWRCAPSTRGGDRKATPGTRARHLSRGDPSSSSCSSSSVGSSSAGSSSGAVPRSRNRVRRRRDRSRGDTNTRSDSTLSGDSVHDNDAADKRRCCILERYVPDREARLRAKDAMSASAAAACQWYNAQAIKARQGVDVVPSLLTTSSSSDIPTSTATPLSSSCATSTCTEEGSSSDVSESLSSTPAVASASCLPLPIAHLSSGADPSRDARGAINFCKSVLIGRYVQPHCAIMDLGCGRGQDVAKMAHARPRCVFFVDVAEEPLVEAERRWCRTRFAFPAAFVQEDFCTPQGLMAHRRVVVHCDDPRRLHGQRHRSVPDHEHALATDDGSGIVDAITCQFAVQYAFDTRESAQAFVANVRRALRPGGVFLGIVADAARLWDLEYRHAQNHTCPLGPPDVIEHRPRRLTFTPTNAEAHAAGPRSHVPCTLTVGSDGEPCPQYTVLFKDLKAMCVEAGLVLMASDDLATFFDVESINPRNASMLERMKAPLRLDDPDDREHLGVYRVFAFARADRAMERPAPALGGERNGRDPRHTGAHRERPPCRVISYAWSSDVANRS
nr:mRNA guanine-N(7)-methyltransferase [Pandoravirus massiliensis]